MDRALLASQREWLREELNRCADFWLQYGWDRRHGGVYTCLDREGKVYSTDKSVWMQGRCAWMYAYLCRTYGIRQEWLDFARSCLDFLEAFCIQRAKGGRMYFTVTEDGKPLRQRRYCFSEAFYAIANAEYAALTGDEACMRRAREAYALIWGLNTGALRDPVGLGPKTLPETRAGRALAAPMIYLNMSSVLYRCDPANAALYDERSRLCASDILAYHFKPDMRCTLENVGPQGEVRDHVTEGRVVNPGHDIECSWFLMEYAARIGDAPLCQSARDMFDFAVETGWDAEYGGLLYFIDCLGLPTEACEHDMKLWWPHCETLIAPSWPIATRARRAIWTGSAKRSPTAATCSATRRTANGSAICAATGSRPCPPSRAARSRGRSICRACSAWPTSSSARYWNAAELERPDRFPPGGRKVPMGTAPTASAHMTDRLPAPGKPGGLPGGRAFIWLTGGRAAFPLTNRPVSCTICPRRCPCPLASHIFGPYVRRD